MIFCFLIFFILGIGIVSFLPIPFFVYLIFLFFLIIFCLVASRELIKKFLPLMIVCFVGFSLGTIRLNLSYPPIDGNRLSFYNEKKIVWQGKVRGEPEEKLNKIDLEVEAMKIIAPIEKEIKGKALVSVPFYSDYQYGDILTIEGKLQAPAKLESFDYQSYLAAKDIYSLSYYPKIEIFKRSEGNLFLDKILKLKDKIKNLIEKNFTEPQGSLISAIFLGEKGLIPAEVKEFFSLTGIAHLLAVSGLHIVTLMSIFSFILIEVFLVSRRKTFYFLLPLVSLYIIFVGSPASALRAGIMGLVLVFSETIGKKRDQLNLLVFTAFILLLFNPKLLCFDIGFQLSFLAVLGIYFLNQDFERLFSRIPNLKYWPLRSYFSVTLSAQIFIFPLILYYFGNLSLGAPLVNILVLPFLPLLMSFIFVFALGALILPFLAKILLWPAWIIITYIFVVARFFARLRYFSFSFGNLLMNWRIYLVIFLYFLIVLLVFKLKKSPLVSGTTKLENRK